MTTHTGCTNLNNESQVLTQRDAAASEDDVSEDDKLVIETPTKRQPVKKRKKLEITAEEKKLLEEFEQIFEDALSEKAAKRNLKVSHVKHILRHVVTNEHLLDFLRSVENPDEKFQMQYEPKITRSKARELDVAPTLPNWVEDEEPSETQVLITEELPEDDSEDDYVPGEEESEDENNTSIMSESPSNPEESPSHSADCGTQTNWTEDGISIFKAPPNKKPKTKTTQEELEEEANIARRTRSKLSLSDKRLEEIEKSFIPPDVPKNQVDHNYDDNEAWQEFLKEFMRPLDEVVTAPEDEENDPEYNILADVEIQDFDEMRSDKTSRVTQQELNNLIHQLMDFSDNYNEYFVDGKEAEQTDTEPEAAPLCDMTISIRVMEESEIIVMLDDQFALFEQQMRHHVQILTQGFLLTYEHPQLDHMSVKYKQYLEDLNEICHESSFYKNTNISEGLITVYKWEEKLKSSTPDVREYKAEVSRTLCEAKEKAAAGLAYIPRFPKLLMETIAYNSVFVYPSFLPRIPYTEANNKNIKVMAYTESENQLIALGLEQFIPFLKTDSYYMGVKGEVRLREVSAFIHRFMLPVREASYMYKHISFMRNAKSANPINTYFEKNTVWPTTHYVVPLSEYNNIPPCNRNPNELPFQWREFVHPETNESAFVANTLPITKVTKPPVYNKKFARRRSTGVLKTKSPKPITSKVETPIQARVKTTLCRTFLPTEITSSTPKCKKSLFKLATPGVQHTIDESEALLKVKFNSSIFSQSPKSKMSSMPSLDMDCAVSMSDIKNMPTQAMPEINNRPADVPATPDTPNFNNIFKEEGETEEEVIEVINISDSIEKINSVQEPSEVLCVTDNSESEKTMCDNSQPVTANMEEKDNLDDINALVVASSTIKTATKRRPTGLEKKRAKKKRDFADNLRLLTEEEDDVLNEKRDRFIQAFYDKVQDTLVLEDFHRFMAALNDFDEETTSPKVLYSQVAEIVAKKHPDIMEEFLLFFDSLQAKMVGKLVPYLMLSNMRLFLRKLEVFFKDQPSQVRRIYRAITDLSVRTDVTMMQVKSTVLPLLKGNSLLTDWFLQIFPMERPPARLLNGAWETICLGKDADDNYETLLLPEVDDPYGGANCICSCHLVEDVTYKARSRHCTPCGTKFMQGRVYLHTKKGLRPAKISFADTSIDHKARLNASLKKRQDTSPTKVISPGKDSQDETRVSSDDEPEKKQQRLLKAAKKRNPRKKPNEHKNAEKQSQVKPNKPAAKQQHSKKAQQNRLQPKQIANEVVDIVDVDATPMVMPEEHQEWDFNIVDSAVEIQPEPSPEPEACQSAESESECCEEFETSQDNNSDTDEASGNDVEQTTTAKNSEPWTKQEDKVILETFQTEEVIDAGFKRILQQLTNRNLDEVKERFDVLMNFLKKVRDIG